MVKESLAEKIVGRRAPAAFPVLDSEVMEMADAHRVIREDIKLNKIRYKFPAGLNKLDLFEECRALTLLDDFQAMYDITMQMLVDKDLIVEIKNEDGTYTELCSVHVTDRFQDLRGNDKIDQYPVLITWLTEFMAELLVKKYPLPGKAQPQPKAAMKKSRGGKEPSSRPR